MASPHRADVNQPRLAFRNPSEDAVEAQMVIDDEFEVVQHRDRAFLDEAWSV